MKRAVLVTLATLLAAACHQHGVRQHSPTPPEGSSVQIISVIPSLGTALRIGENIALQVKARHSNALAPFVRSAPVSAGVRRREMGITTTDSGILPRTRCIL